MSTAQSVTTTPTAAEDSRDKKIRDSYAAATKHLHDTHLADFNKFRTEYLAAQGVEWAPEPTKAEKEKAAAEEKKAKAAAKIAAIVKDNPDVVDELAALLGVDIVS